MSLFARDERVPLLDFKALLDQILKIGVGSKYNMQPNLIRVSILIFKGSDLQRNVTSAGGAF